jgi:hypothetical protein
MIESTDDEDDPMEQRLRAMREEMRDQLDGASSSQQNQPIHEVDEPIAESARGYTERTGRDEDHQGYDNYRSPHAMSKQDHSEVS